MEQLARPRRIYRLVATLTGRPLAAAEILRSLPEVIPDGPRGERIAVQASREYEFATNSLLEAGLAERFGAQARQVREAWGLRKGMGLGERETAIAMDCSRTVVRNRLEGIEAVFSVEDALAVREAMLKIGIPQDFVRYRQERMRLRKVLLVLVVFAGLVLGLECVRWILAG